MSDLLLSICIPTFNRADCLKQNIESIVSQFDELEIKNLVEIVIYDNGSIDNTSIVVQDFLNKFNNIKYFKHEENIGFDRNLLSVIEKSQGEYCLTVGDDDAFFPRSLLGIISKIKSLRAPYFMLNCWGYDHWLKKPVLSHPNHQLSQDIVYGKLSDYVQSIKNYLDLVGCFGGMSTQLFLRSAWNNFDNKEEYIGTNAIHLFVLLSVFKNEPFARLADPAIKTRNDNLRWDTYPGLETNLKRSVGTAKTVFWISELYKLPNKYYKILTYFLIRGYWISFKEMIKKVLQITGFRKK